MERAVGAKLTTAQLTELVRASGDKVTEFLCSKALKAAKRLAEIMEQDRDLREARQAATKIVEFIVPPAKAPLVSVNNMPTFVSHLNLPAAPAPDPAAIAQAAAQQAIPAPQPQFQKLLPEVAPRPSFGKPHELERLPKAPIDVSALRAPDGGQAFGRNIDERDLPKHETRAVLRDDASAE